MIFSQALAASARATTVATASFNSKEACEAALTQAKAISGFNYAIEGFCQEDKQ